MPAQNIGCYIADEDYALYLKNKEKLNDITRNALKKEIAKLKKEEGK